MIARPLAATLLVAFLLTGCGHDRTEPHVADRPKADDTTRGGGPNALTATTRVGSSPSMVASRPAPTQASTTLVRSTTTRRASRSEPTRGTVVTTTTTSLRSDGRDLGDFEATCYAERGTTASGAQAGPGSIAVDPRVIPLGTHLRVEGYGEGIAEDTGGAIKGRRIDIWKASRAECLQWGRRMVDVEVIG